VAAWRVRRAALGEFRCVESQASENYKRDARVMDYLPLFAAKRVRETLKTRTVADVT